MAIPKAPNDFNGTLEELYEMHAKHVFSGAEIVAEFHEKLCAYLDATDPLFLTRKVGTQTQGQDLTIHCGARLRPTDNSPAWWILYHLLNKNRDLFADFAACMNAAPCQMFSIQLPETLNSAGWHVAPLFEVNDDNLDFMNWTQEELVGRCIRNIHPCNYFYIPKASWKKHSQKAEVLAFFQAKQAELYGSVWDDFLVRANVTPHAELPHAGSYAYMASTRQKQTQKMVYNGIECAASYKDSRLSFHAKVIEPLEMNQRFCIVTPNYYYIMTKGEFYKNFRELTKPGSCYQESGIHYFRSPPKRALPFMIKRNRT